MIKRYLIDLLRYLTLPLALLYGLIIFIRNKFYDWGLSSSLRFTLPMINIGNLSVGGTGKSPHTEYLIQLLKHSYKIATLSRGYKRASQGFVLANETSTARDIGDEPMQFKLNHPEIEVCVCEDRIMAVPSLLQRKPFVQVILLDDAFQHRSIKPSLNILMTDANHLYTNDYILPFGRLREFRSGAKKADIIIVSKCKTNLSIDEKNKIIQEINPLPHQTIFFSEILYKQCYNLFNQQLVDLNNQDLLIISGIANNDSLLDYVRTKTKNFHLLAYRDHHYFTKDDVEEMIEAYNNLPHQEKYLLTTQKDATRLLLHQQMLQNANVQVIVLPIEISFLFEEHKKFDQIISAHLLEYYPPILQEDVEAMFGENATLNSENQTMHQSNQSTTSDQSIIINYTIKN
jgi:tetraacyldisaccharide 4'-kinase